MSSYQAITEHPGLVSFWDFQEEAGEDRVAKGPFPYRLQEQSGVIERVKDGIFGSYSAKLEYGQWFNLPRAECPALNFHGKEAEVTVIAWLKREARYNKGCQAIAGIWNETEGKRQYAMFLDLRIWDSADQICGHISAEGGPTPGYEYCMTTAIGSTPVPKEKWITAAFTYDGAYAKVYLDGQLDQRDVYNPYVYEKGLYDGEAEGADFTVAAVHRSNEIGNFYAGLIGGLAVFNQALTAEEIQALCNR
jgi:hypothetical protein